MKTILTTLAIFSYSFLFAGINPSNNLEYCPLQELYFDIDYPGEKEFVTIQQFNNLEARLVNTSYITSNGTIVSTIFRVAINFHDKQTGASIRIEYRPKGGNPASHAAETFEFSKIKSLFGDARQVNPGISSIEAPYCNITTVNIAFDNLQWRRGSSTLFGTITQYEYSVPAGWSVNGSVSTGPNDKKLGTNTATIVSDGITTGSLIITPVNRACGVNTFSGNPLQIPINRGQINPSFSGAATICSNQTYTASNIPSWVTNVLWEVTPSSLVTNGTSTSNPATFTKATDGIGTIKFTMSNPSCGLSFSFTGQQITGNPNLIVGTPKPQSLYKLYEYCIGGSDWEATFQATPLIGGISYNWKINGSLDTYNHNSSYYTYQFPADCVNLDVQLETGCGTGPWLSADYYGNPATFCPSCFNFMMSMSPNPSKNQVTISSKSTKKPLNIREVRFVDAQGLVRKVVKADGVRQLNIDISSLQSGRYFVNVFDGKEWVSQILIKN